MVNILYGKGGLSMPQPIPDVEISIDAPDSTESGNDYFFDLKEWK